MPSFLVMLIKLIAVNMICSFAALISRDSTVQINDKNYSVNTAMTMHESCHETLITYRVATVINVTSYMHGATKHIICLVELHVTANNLAIPFR